MKKLNTIVAFIILLNFCYISTSFGNPYSPPIGIPAPSFGINETVESIYGSADYYTYYVDNTHVASTDTANIYGSPEKPRKTIPKDFVAGDDVQVHGGPYPISTGRQYIRGQGTASQPIIITGANAASKPVLERFVHFSDSQYIIFENFKIQTPGGSINIRPLADDVAIHHISVRHTDVVGTGKFKKGSGMSVSTTLNTPIEHIVFYKNTSVDSGQWDAETEDDSPCFAIQANVRHAWILENIGYRSGGDGVILAHGANYSTNHIYIGKNTFYQNRENGIDLKQANDVVVSQNKIYNHRPTSSSSGEGIVVHYDPSRIWILYNEIYDCEYGIVSTGMWNSAIIGNLIYNIHHSGEAYDPHSGYSRGAAIHSRNSAELTIANNTLYDYDTGIQSPSVGGIVSLVNNIFSERAEAESYDVYFGNSKQTNAVDFSNNLFFHSNGEVRIGWGSTTGISLTQLKSNYSETCTNCLEDNPLFASPPSSFSINEKSPAADSGQTPIAYSTYKNLYNENILVDIVGKSRSGVLDIGAYEANTSAPSPTIKRIKIVD